MPVKSIIYFMTKCRQGFFEMINFVQYSLNILNAKYEQRQQLLNVYEQFSVFILIQ